MPTDIVSEIDSVMHFSSRSRKSSSARSGGITRERFLARIGSVLIALSLLAGSALAQSPADWIKRILDPKTIGVTPPPGATLNRKLSVDYLSKEDPPKKMAIYMAPLDQMQAVSAHFEKTLKVKPTVTGAGSEFEIQRFVLEGGGDYPKESEGLTITISRSQWVDNKLQITMEYVPKN